MPKKSNTPPMGFFSAFNDPRRNTRASAFERKQKKPKLGEPSLYNPSGYGFRENLAAQEALNRKLLKAQGGSPSSPLKKKRDKRGRFTKEGNA